MVGFPSDVGDQSLRESIGFVEEFGEESHGTSAVFFVGGEDECSIFECFGDFQSGENPEAVIERGGGEEISFLSKCWGVGEGSPERVYFFGKVGAVACGPQELGCEGVSVKVFADEGDFGGEGSKGFSNF